MKVLAFDVGHKGAFSFKDKFEENTEAFDFITLDDYLRRVLALIRLYKPDIVGCSYPTFRYSVIVFQSKLGAIIELACEKTQTPFMEINDSQAKKKVLGKGKANKIEIMDAMGQPTEHLGDALMFSRYIYSFKDEEGV